MEEEHIESHALRGDRGRGRGQICDFADATLAYPSLAPVPPCSSPPPVPHNLGHPSIQKTSQRAELRFDCTSNSSILTAYIIVTLREEIPNLASP